jgi:tRNA nucleotidyltransferase/poly(A) polymerase
MRAVRFKNHLGFEYDEETFQAIKQAAEQGKVAEIATDRLRNELTALLVHPTRRQAIQDLDELGILAKVLPEVTAGKGTDQPHKYHAEGDVLRHELLILDQLPDHPSKRLAWAEVVQVNLRSGDPWVSLDLADGTTLAVMGIQPGIARERAVADARALRALVDQHGSAAPEPPGGSPR